MAQTAWLLVFANRIEIGPVIIITIYDTSEGQFSNESLTDIISWDYLKSSQFHLHQYSSRGKLLVKRGIILLIKSGIFDKLISKVPPPLHE